MKSSHSTNVPSLYIKKEGEQTQKMYLRLARAQSPVIVRFTGGCGHMSGSDAYDLYDLFIEAFKGFSGAILFGGTRMLSKSDPAIITPGITEIPPLIKDMNPSSQILGIVPRSEDLRISEHGVIISDEKDNDFFTIIHPFQDQCLIVQQSADKGVDWEAEYKECMEIMKDFKETLGWKCVTISYNGGGVTEKEILACTQVSQPVILVHGSGRISNQYATDQDFLMKNPEVHVAQKTVKSIREALNSLEAI